MTNNYASYPSLVDRTVFITGGADGIGSAMVEQFARRFGVDLKHARKVAHFALELFHALGNLHLLPLGI